MKSAYLFFRKSSIVLTLLSIALVSLTAQVEIYNQSQLRNIASNLSGDYKLMSNISLTEDWAPIGNEIAPFTGTFNGNGYVISGIRIHQAETNSQGFFGYTSDAVVKNLGIEEASIQAKTNVGAIVGYQHGGSIAQCYVHNSVIKGEQYVGSITGKMSNTAKILNCFASASTAIKTNTDAGGIAGTMSSGKISMCYFAGTVSADEARANGILGVVDAGETDLPKTIEYSVNLAPSLLVHSTRAYPFETEHTGKEHVRIADQGNSSSLLHENYSIGTTVLGQSLETATVLAEKEGLIMSFNIPYFSDSESNEFKRWNYRKDAIAAFIKEKKPVILGMQEIRKNPQLDFLDSQLSDEYARIGVGRDDGANGGDFSVIYYRKDFFELIKNGDFWMSETPAVPSFGWGASFRRVTSWGHFRLKGTDKEILIYNTHFDHAAQKAIEESFKLMRDSIAGRMTNGVYSVITTGDYNTGTNNVFFKPLSDFLNNSRDDALLTDKRETFNGWGDANQYSQIDHILYKNCVPKSFNVITGTYQGVALMSDHNPITAVIGIPLDKEYGADREHGATIVKESDIKTRQFYSYKLQWDFFNIWEIEEGNGLPTLKIFNKTPVNTYEIADEAGLKSIVNDLSGIYTLTADIHLSQEWSPIGTDVAPFKGVLNGNGKIIRGLQCSNAATKKVGLFAVTQDAIIRNLGVENVTINGDADVAAIVGVMNGGLMEACYVANSTITGRDHVASLVGKLQAGALLQNCYASADVSSRATQAGGLCGVILDTGTKISKSYFSGKVSTPVNSQRPGGIVSLVDNDGRVTVENCVNLAASITGSNQVRIAHWFNYGLSTTLNNNYSISTTEMTLAGDWMDIENAQYGHDKMQGANVPEDSDLLSSSFYVDVLRWDFSATWKFSSYGGYPLLSWQQDEINVSLFAVKSDISMMQSEVLDLNRLVKINNASQLLDFSSSTQGVNISDKHQLTLAADFDITQSIQIDLTTKAGAHLLPDAAVQFDISVIPDTIYIEEPADLSLIEMHPGAHFKLVNDIDLTRIKFNGLCSEAIPFTGTFDGNGHIISNLSFAASGRRGVGFFNVTRGATIRNVGLEHASVKLNSNHKSAGVLIGLMRGGLLEQSYVSDSYVEGYDHVGSVVGSIEGLNEKLGAPAEIKNCYGADNEVVTRSYQAGGFSGTIMKGIVTNCYFSGTVRSANRAVGLFGYVDNSGHGAADVVVRACLNLASEIKSTGFQQEKLFRILDNNKANDRPMTLINNYSTPETNLSGSDIQTGTATVEVSLTGRNGANLPRSTDALQSGFYRNRLNWDFTEIWDIEENVSYPFLKVFAAQASSLYMPDTYAPHSIRIHDRTLCIADIEHQTQLSIFTVQGVPIVLDHISSGTFTFQLPDRGVYLVQLIHNKRKELYKVIF